MATNKSSNSPVAKKASVRPVDAYFDQYSRHHQSRANILLHWTCVPLIVFSLFGLVWTIPFPSIKFLGSYNGYFNWDSFLIAIVVYYYYKLSPTLSYFMLFVLMGFSYGVIELAEWQKSGGPAMWLVCLVIFVAAWAGLFMGHKMEGKKSSFLDNLRFLVIGPLWLLHFILKRLSIKY